jgi:carboxypeptidase Q
MKMRSLRTLLALAVLAALLSMRPGSSGGETPRYQETVDRLREAGLTSERAQSLLARIVSVGPRLTGSPQAAAAVQESLKLMNELGLENVHAEPVEVGRWVRGNAAEASVPASAGRAAVSLAICALGGSVGTPEKGLIAPVVEVLSLAELDRLGRSLRGKIVLFNRPMDRRTADPFAAYGAAADQRVNGASAAARFGAVAVLVRSLTFRVDRFPHTGLMLYTPGQPEIPAAAIGTADADVLSALLKKDPSTRVFLRMDCGGQGRVMSANVVGEITGSERPSEIILVGGHLDSWDLAVGAHDDASGCAAALEAVRLIRDLGLRPRRTVRVVFFMDEEFGGTGGRAYVAAPGRRGERHLAAAESDRGGFAPVGLALGGFARKTIEPLAGLFRPLGVAFVAAGGGGVDVGPLIERGAAPAAVLVNSAVYFDLHHSALDTASSVHPRELELQAVILAGLAYILAEEPE